jgi:hypothetical protein
VTSGPSAKRAEFAARTSATGVETWESSTLGANIDGAVITINGINGTFSLPTYGVVENNGTVSGEFNTTSGGSKWLDADPNVVITFASPIAGFGMYGTDFGDFNSQMSWKLYKTGGGTVTHTIGHTVNSLNNGALIFTGFVDDTDTYDKVEMLYTDLGDAVGLDDITWFSAATLV